MYVFMYLSHMVLRKYWNSIYEGGGATSRGKLRGMNKLILQDLIGYGNQVF